MFQDTFAIHSHTNHLPVDNIVSTEAKKNVFEKWAYEQVSHSRYTMFTCILWDPYLLKHEFDAVELAARRAHKSNSQWIEYSTLSWIRRGRCCCSSFLLFFEDLSEKDRSKNKTKDSRKLIEREWAKWNLRSIEIQNLILNKKAEKRHVSISESIWLADAGVV